MASNKQEGDVNPHCVVESQPDESNKQKHERETFAFNIEAQKIRIKELQNTIECASKERDDMRDKLRQIVRSTERLEAYFSSKLDAKERELRYFLFPSSARPTVLDSEVDKPQVSTINSTVRPVPSLIGGLTKPSNDSLLGPASFPPKAATTGNGLLPTPSHHPPQISTKPLISSSRTGSSRTNQLTKSNLLDPTNCSSNTKELGSYTDVLVDPAVNLVLSRLRRIQCDFNSLVTANQTELQSYTFTQNSQIGKRMMMRIRVLEQENEELANMNQTGRTARLESEIALRRAFVNDLKHAHADMEFLVEEAETETEMLGSSVLMLQQKLQLLTKTAQLLACELEKLQPGSTSHLLDINSINWHLTSNQNDNTGDDDNDNDGINNDNNNNNDGRTDLSISPSNKYSPHLIEFQADQLNYSNCNANFPDPTSVSNEIKNVNQPVECNEQLLDKIDESNKLLSLSVEKSCEKELNRTPPVTITTTATTNTTVETKKRSSKHSKKRNVSNRSKKSNSIDDVNKSNDIVEPLEKKKCTDNDKLSIQLNESISNSTLKSSNLIPNVDITSQTISQHHNPTHHHHRHSHRHHHSNKHKDQILVKESLERTKLSKSSLLNCENQDLSKYSNSNPVCLNDSSPSSNLSIDQKSFRISTQSSNNNNSKTSIITTTTTTVIMPISTAAISTINTTSASSNS